MDLSLSEEQQLIVDMVRRFVREEVVPLENDLDPDEDTLPPEQFAKLVAKTKEMGLYGLGIPPEYGGPDIDIMTRSLIAIENSQHRAGLYAPCYGAFGGSGLAQLYEATEEQKEKYLYPTLRGEKKAAAEDDPLGPEGEGQRAGGLRQIVGGDGPDGMIGLKRFRIAGAGADGAGAGEALQAV